MKDKTFENHIKEFYGLPENTKVVCFKNHLDYSIEFIENINPTHKKYIYGRKWNRKSNYEKIAKIIVPSLLISEIFTLSIFLSVAILGLFTSFLVIGFYTSGTYELFIDITNKIYEVFIYAQTRKYDYRDTGL